jgi:hypothetical protein
MVSTSVLVFPPHFGSCQRECLGIGIPVCQTGLSTAPGFIPLNSHQKCHSIAAAVSGHPGKLLPLPPNRELRPNLDGSLDSDADPEGRRVLDPGGSKVRCAGFVFPANLSHSHHGSSWLADRDGMVHDFFYIGIKAAKRSSEGTSTYDWHAGCLGPFERKHAWVRRWTGNQVPRRRVEAFAGRECARPRTARFLDSAKSASPGMTGFTGRLTAWPAAG